MIASIEGEIILSEETSLIIRVGGVGLRVFVPTSVGKVARRGENIFLFTSLIVREDSLSLYGFETSDERQFFDLLLSVNGIGPRTSLAVLSTLSVDAIRRAILAEQPEVFARVPGIGKRTGQKILLQLQGKVGGEVSSFATSLLDVDQEVLEALTALGYSLIEAQSAIQSIPRDSAKDVENRLRLALQYFST